MYVCMYVCMCVTKKLNPITYYQSKTVQVGELIKRNLDSSAASELVKVSVAPCCHQSWDVRFINGKNSMERAQVLRVLATDILF
jgi:hypothetical protein